MHKLKYVVDGLKLIVAYCIAKILRLFKSNRNIWLIGERKDEAKDNGYHLFKYIRENHKEDKVYYIIDRKSKDLEKIQKFGNIIYADTFKHYLYYALANKLVIAHLGSCVPDSPVCWKAESLKVIKPKRAFIQHGITKELIPSLMYENTKVDLFICGAKPEYDFVKSEFGYPEDSVKYTGFARFDNLHDFKEKNQILVMPTWRQWIPSMTWNSKDNDKCKREFLESEYYKRFNELISSKELENLLIKNNTKLIFYPHHEMQGYLGLFRTKLKNIEIANEDKYDVQKLLKDSSVLITDYSSVAFDFAYMKKNIIYYQFDKKDYDTKHYSQGYFDYELNGFGPVVYELSRLIDKLSDYLKSTDKDKIVFKDEVNKFIYRKRYEKFFPLYDNKNNKRIYEMINRM